MRYDGNESGGPAADGRAGGRPGNAPGYQRHPHRRLAAPGAADGQRAPADGRKPLFLPQRGAGGQDLLQGGGPAPDDPGGLPGASVTGRIESRRPRRVRNLGWTI